jgi:hypothetical protein
MTNDFDIRTERRRRPPWLAPVVVGLAALPIGAALALGITGRGGDTVGAGDPQSTTSTIADTASTVPDSSTTSSAVESTTTMAGPETTAVDTGTTLPAGPPAERTLRVDGETFIETYSCIAFPNSNPDAGIGDAGIRVSMHLMESGSGDRISLERWSYDFGGAIGISRIGGPTGMVETFDINQVEPYIVPIDGVDVVVEVGPTTTSGDICATLIAQGAGEFDFTALGLVDVCSVSDDLATDLVYTFQSGQSLAIDGDVSMGETTFTGTLTHEDGVSEVVDGAFEVAESGSTRLVGTLDPGTTGAAPESFAFDLSASPRLHSCLPAQEVGRS